MVYVNCIKMLMCVELTNIWLKDWNLPVNKGLWGEQKERPCLHRARRETTDTGRKVWEMPWSNGWCDLADKLVCDIQIQAAMFPTSLHSQVHAIKWSLAIRDKDRFSLSAFIWTLFHPTLAALCSRHWLDFLLISTTYDFLLKHTHSSGHEMRYIDVHIKVLWWSTSAVKTEQ